MNRLILPFFIVLVSIIAGGCGEKPSLEGKVVDEKGQPLGNFTVVAKQVQAVEGYEQFSIVTNPDGSFLFGGLYPNSEYVLIPSVEDWRISPVWILKYEPENLTATFNKDGWTSENKMKVQTMPGGKALKLTSPMVIYPCISGIEGMIVDGGEQPMPGVTVTVTQTEPVPGYEKFEATTGSDGRFKFSKIFPSSEYVFIFQVKGYEISAEITMQSREAGQTLELTTPVKSAYMTKKDGTVMETRTGLMWAAKDNGKDISWVDAKRYCENYRGGGYADWRMPTWDELSGLYDPTQTNRHGFHMSDEIEITRCCPWASEARDHKALYFDFRTGADKYWRPQSGSASYRALPVRSGD